MVRHIEGPAAGRNRPLLDSRLRGNDAGGALAPLTTHRAPYRHPRESGGPSSRHGRPPVAPSPARGRPRWALPRAGMDGGAALSWIPACAGMTGRRGRVACCRLRGNDAGPALAPLTTHHAPYRHPRESGGPDGPHLPAVTRNWRPRGCPRRSGGPDSRPGHPPVAPPPARGRPRWALPRAGVTGRVRLVVDSRLRGNDGGGGPGRCRPAWWPRASGTAWIWWIRLRISRTCWRGSRRGR